jgi:hypothetical protein
MSSQLTGPNGPVANAGIDFGVVSEAWKLLTQQVGPWVAAMVVMGIVSALVNQILDVIFFGPVGWPMAKFDLTGLGIASALARAGMGAVVSALVDAFFVAGAFLMAIEHVRTGRARVELLFSGGRHYPQMLLLCVLWHLLLTMGMIACILPCFILAGLFLISPLLVLDRGMNAVDALVTSLRLLQRNAIEATLLAILTVLVALAGVIACGVGVFITLPMIFLVPCLLYRNLLGWYSSASGAAATGFGTGE